MYQRDGKGRPKAHPDNLNALALATIGSGEPIADSLREFVHSQSPVNLANLCSALAEYATTHRGFSDEAVLDIANASDFIEAEIKARRERLAQ